MSEGAPREGLSAVPTRGATRNALARIRLVGLGCTDYVDGSVEGEARRSPDEELEADAGRASSMVPRALGCGLLACIACVGGVGCGDDSSTVPPSDAGPSIDAMVLDSGMEDEEDAGEPWTSPCLFEVERIEHSSAPCSEWEVGETPERALPDRVGPHRAFPRLASPPRPRPAARGRLFPTARSPPRRARGYVQVIVKTSPSSPQPMSPPVRRRRSRLPCPSQHIPAPPGRRLSRGASTRALGSRPSARHPLRRHVAAAPCYWRL